MIDLAAARTFMATHARLLDRRRFALLVGDGGPDAVLAALAAYRNADGGYGALEPDLRSPESQPVGAYHAFEVMAEVLPATTPDAVGLCDWLDSVTLPDGGLPFALPITDPTGCAPFWADADATASTLHATAMVAGTAHLVARGDPAVRDHPWLARATDHCMARLATDDPAHAYELMFTLRFLDAVVDVVPGAREHLARLAADVPPSGRVPVAGGVEGEALRPLDLAPEPWRPIGELLATGVVAADVTRLGLEQEDDGGWSVPFRTWSPAAALEWRGYLTVHAVGLLKANGGVHV